LLLRRVLLASAVLALLVPAGRVHAATFTFDSVASLTATPLALTDGGVTATFTSPGGNDFFTFPSAGLFVTMAGNVLVAGADAQTDALTVAFSAPQSLFSVQFGLNTFTAAVPFTLTAYLGAAQVGTSSATGSLFNFVEGTLMFSGATFDRVVLTTAAQDFAIDNLTVRLANVPEPAVMTLLASAIVALTSRRRAKP
jgi:hypothetical protein